METRANYVLIGAFTLLGILGALGFFLWLAKFEVDRHYAYYDVLFDNVSGLGQAGSVRYNGLPVGQVVRLQLDPGDPSKVQVRIEVDAKIPVKTDTKATLELQGVTGVSYVALAGGSAGAPLLTAQPGQDVPVIVGAPSAVANLLDAAPKLISKAIVLLEDLQAMVGPENRAAVGQILANLESASGRLDSTLSDFSSLSADLSAASAKIGNFTDRLGPVADSAAATLGTADETLKVTREALDKAKATIDEATSALASARRAFDTANGLIGDRLPGLIDQVETTAGTIDRVVADLGGKAGGVADKIGQLSDVAIARLTEVDATLAKINAAVDATNAAMASVKGTSENVNTLVTGDGAALVADARKAVDRANVALDSANKVLSTDLPAILSDIRGATQTVNRTVTDVGAQLSGATNHVDGLVTEAGTALASATETFRKANDTLAAISDTMARADATLTAAQSTFEGANRIMNTDVSGIVGDFRNSAAKLDTAIGTVAADLPAITGEMRHTVERASVFVDSLNRIVVSNSDEIKAFMQAGLPQFVTFVAEGRKLVGSLQRLTEKIERDPARFLLGTQTPEFRR